MPVPIQNRNALSAVERAVVWLKSRHPPDHWSDTRADPLTIMALLDCGEHPQSPIIREGVNSLLRRQDKQTGSWSDEAWDTSYVARALVRSGISLESREIRAAVKWLLDLQDPRTGSWHGEVWETSFVLLCLKETDMRSSKNAVERAEKWLHEAQLNDGSWLHSPQTTSVALLALANLLGKSKSVQKASKWLMDYGSNEVWCFESYANAYSIMALTKCGFPFESASVQRGIKWLINNQTILEIGSSGYWSDEEDTSLAITAITSALRLQFGERKVVMTPLVGECSIFGGKTQLNWQISTPSNDKVAHEVQFDISINRRITDEIDKFGGGAVRSLQAKSGPNRKFNDQIEKLKELGTSIWDFLIPKEIHNVLRAQRMDHLQLELSGDPSLSMVPWELAYDGEDFLSMKFAMGRQIIPRSVRMLTKTGSRRSKSKPKILLVGDTSGNLSGAELEVLKIRNNLERMGVAECTLLRDTRGGKTKLGFLREVAHGSYDMVHYAGHAVVDRSNPTESYLPFWEEDNSVSKLFASQIGNAMMESRDLKVVFLNACSSALQDSQSYMEEANGLANAFLSKGIPVFIGPLWPVDDSDAVDFASSFYSNAIKGFTVGESMRIARVESSRKKNTRSASWASFVLYGNPTIMAF